jgi:hypothetical protein
MDEFKPTVVHVFPFAANSEAPYLLTGLGSPWQSLPVPLGRTIHEEMERTVEANGVNPDPAAGECFVLHSPSWHDSARATVLVYFAIINAGEFVIDQWPNALPIDGQIRDEAGLPPLHGATMPPAVRRLDVALHSLRLAAAHADPTSPFFDATMAAKLDPNWRRHLAGLTPALSGLYAVDYDAA